MLHFFFEKKKITIDLNHSLIYALPLFILKKNELLLALMAV